MPDKKWYSYFVSVESDPAEEPSARAAPRPPAAEGRRSAAQTVAEIAATVGEPKLTGRVSDAASFEEIYRAAEIRQPAHGYTIAKVADMLQSEHIRNLPREVKRSSVLVALDAAGVQLDQIIQDAVQRDRALDAYERVQQKALEALEAQKSEENRKIQADLDRLVAEHRARMQANQDAVAKERERLRDWRVRKQQEEERIAETVSYFATENPITTQGRAAAPPSPPPGRGA